ncbi:MAG: DNA topoisomerase IV subunit A [Spirochaetales bacterium]
MAYVQKLFNDNFLEYASYVIKERAIPHLDDGLKPVQRRIVHSLLEMDDGKFHKVANVVGHTMKYHPHGDASIYEALVNLGQKDMFIDRQGNFGNIFTGDSAAAGRYIECRLLPLAKEILYNPEITEFVDSYDGRNQEPVVFPAKLPVVLLQGVDGIAVGMSTTILPHNFREVVQALQACLRGENFQLLPDFPTGGMMDATAYQDGMGSVLVRAKLDTSDEKRIVVRELPFGATTASLIDSIETAAKKGKLKIAGLSDFTTDKVEIEIKLPRGVYTSEVVEALYAFTDCQINHHVNLLVIHDDLPVLMTVTEVVEYHAKHLVEVLKKELELEQRKLLDKLHLRTLERIFIEERIYKRMEEMKTQEAVYEAVLTGFEPFAKELIRPVTDDDIKHLLEIPIRRISLYDISKNRQEVEAINKRLKEIKYHLAHLTEYALGFLDELLKKPASQTPRLTKASTFRKLGAREVAARDKKLRYDKASGYLGYSLSTGDVKLEVSDLDKVLLIHKDLTYSVIRVPEKKFAGKGLLGIWDADKDELDKVTFSVLYKDNSTGNLYLKRFKIEGYILDKVYEFMPEDSQFLKMTTKVNVSIHVDYKQKPLLRVLEEAFPVNKYLVKGVKALGVRITNKDFNSAKFVRTGSAGSEDEPEGEEE